MRLRSLALVLCAATLGLAACGGDDANDKAPAKDSGSTAARGYAATGAAVDAICVATNAPGQALLKGLNGKPAHDAPLLDRAVAVYSRGIDRMRQIDPDPKLKDAFDHFLQLAEDQVTLLEELRDTAKSGNAADYKLATTKVVDESATTEAARKQASTALGATRCANS
jgi:hypothetical protein